MADMLELGLVLLGAILGIVIGYLLGSKKDNGSEVRSELREMSRDTRDSIQQTVVTVVKELGEEQQKHLVTVGKNISNLQESNEKKLDEMRVIVDEKLQETLDKRITASFEVVSKQLQDVHNGLGEMKILADDVGGLKKILANVSTRGAFGELQAHQILENFLAPEQFGVNVQTNPNYNGTVEFAVALPGSADSDDVLWLPIDCKFPIEDHQKWLEASESGDKAAIESARKALVTNVKKKAETIAQKYIAPPHTTEFAVMFLPTEGLYADVARQKGLLEILQRDYNILLCGPSNLSAFISSIKVGFRTLALGERAGDVTKVLGAVKSEFAKFGKTIESAHKTANTLTNKLSLEGEVQVRLRAMDKILKKIEALDAPSLDLTDLLEE